MKMGCLRLTYDHEETPTLFLEQAPEKVEAPELRVWVNPDSDFLEVGEESLNNAGPFGSVINLFSDLPFTGSKADRSTYFEGIRVYSTTLGPMGDHKAGTVPGLGIFVNPSELYDIDLLSHEFGHILQYRIWGPAFYVTMASASVASVNRADNDPSYDHQWSWTEWTANYFSYNYFGQPSNWNFTSNPIQPPVSTMPGIYPPINIFDFYSTKIPRRN